MEQGYVSQTTTVEKEAQTRNFIVASSVECAIRVFTKKNAEK